MVPAFVPPMQAATPPPSGYFANAVRIDAAGSVYIAGYILASSNQNAPADAFVSKLSRDGSQTIWSVNLGGSGDDRAVALALGPGNSVYVAGSTKSTDFPVTKGAFATSGGSFAARLDGAGTVVYSTYIPATSAL